MKFSDFGFLPAIMDGIRAMGFEEPTPVQEQAIPHIMQGKDVIACAQTGTGKTAAFILPILNKLTMLPARLNYISTLVIVPTRELAIQIDQHLEGFGYFAPASSIAVYGGNDSAVWDKQRVAIQRGVDFIIATPGRLIQHIRMGYVNLDRVEHLVLDEADRMLDMGFYEDIVEIVSLLPAKRQTLLFSATMPDNIRKLALKTLHNPVEVNIAVSKPADNVLQAVYEVDEGAKIPLLGYLLKGKDNVKSAIIFASTKVKVKSIERALIQNGLSAMAIHSDLDQKDREEVLRLFKNRKFQLLVATDIVSRGIDIEDIDLIVNFDVPHDPEDYVHRIGRTARAEADGVAITFVNSKEKTLFKKIEVFLGSKIFRIPLPGSMK
ncbi:MAG: DEAD/DEAH box helicase [Tenuifilaceae bacterium]|nr:DEAD/DEAH box helicase [Bacteroidales bacterium]MDI9515380.1 DEAD/DEAH box helicase [Bacteroidota bacterium]NLH55452.1 DEAD/DEAH box helicase [Rikenellaceae bacterium]OQC62473.1 MAG: ATP-dependent RNA helicase RhlE [Bacteroidetes bacterium ADurb.Bin008]HNV81930.1 DEAD/DEAH box helicase [Tenuifilaceae bacterium]